MMAMGSMYPFMGASLYPMSHLAGSYGMYGPMNVSNIGAEVNSYGGSDAYEERPAADVKVATRKLKITDDGSDASKANEVANDIAELETSKKLLINTLKKSLKALRSS